MPRPLILWGWMLLVGLTLGLEAGVEAKEKGETVHPSDSSRAIARQILDDALPQADREALIAKHPEASAELVAALVEDLTPGTDEEYRRIPWIWRVAIAGGRRNDAKELAQLLDASLPAPSARLDDWRAVVIGGGLINGVSLEGIWPAARFQEVLDGRPDLKPRWHEAIELASVMADDEKIKTGTRYDALRMLGVEPWDRCGAQLFRYLVKGVDPELQQGGVSGLADVPTPCAGPALLSGMNHYTPHVQNFALDALLRDEDRISALLDAVAEGRLDKSKLGAKRIATLVNHPQEDLKRRAVELLGAEK
ncbi:hypothetical protein [Singulisphaera acidiphila]|uniref:HEAT repeat protein n=1 Tax=Singulisphaera acidiphila (strain ATCC BAA-1392 / DSM 18658 / VKM B-2454 / MOB10) TaxID=886293 RepID=L0DL26_SINAD|nr:hypothetical protein [Singulisphaera acidiphila]AGA29356.1 hypothetical protein Sinac_5204 [Singulisphaera acidiphila DSM 18658]